MFIVGVEPQFMPIVHKQRNVTTKLQILDHAQHFQLARSAEQAVFVEQKLRQVAHILLIVWIQLLLLDNVNYIVRQMVNQIACVEPQQERFAHKALIALTYLQQLVCAYHNVLLQVILIVDVVYLLMLTVLQPKNVIIKLPVLGIAHH